MSMRSFPQPRHSRYHWPFAPRRRCQRWSRSLHRQGLAIVASLGIGHTGSMRRPYVQRRENTPLVLLAHRDPRLIPAISPGQSRGASPGLTRQRRRRPGRRGARASSQFDHYDGTGRKAKHASVPFRHAYAIELRCKKFLYELKAGPAGGRLRRPSSAGSVQGRGLNSPVHIT